jgi:DNA-binding NarL/FixJ family response regulator
MPDSPHQNRQLIPVALISRPGVMQQSLRTALGACHWVEVVASYGDGLTALNRLAGFHRGIMAIDSNLLDEEVDALLETIKNRQPDIRCLVLVHGSGRQRQLLTQGADAVILRDRSAWELQDALARLAQELLDLTHD